LPQANAPVYLLARIQSRLKALRLDDAEPVRIGGWAFRGLLNLPVTWDAA
jgi:hypothetical protein